MKRQNENAQETVMEDKERREDKYTFLAKSSPEETLESHTKALLERYEVLKKYFKDALPPLGWEVLKDASLFHDMGKTIPYFQKLIGGHVWDEVEMEVSKREWDEIMDCPIPFRHNLLSPMFISREKIISRYEKIIAHSNRNLEDNGDGSENTFWGKKIPTDTLRIAGNVNQLGKKALSADCAYDILIKAVLYHHVLESNYIFDNLKTLEQLIGKYAKTIENHPKILRHLRWVDEILKEGMIKISGHRLIPNYSFIGQCKFQGGREDCDGDEYEIWYFLIKGLLNKLDYSASAGIDVEEIVSAEDSIGSKVERFMQTKGYAFRGVQTFMRSHREDNVIVESGTGSGKTEAALMWIGDDKGFYTLPLKVAINAMVGRIQDPGGINYSGVKLLHGDAFIHYLKSEKEDKVLAYQKYNYAKLLGSKLSVCTIDQLFKYVYKHNGCEPSFASMALGKTVIDEIQMYEPRLIATLICGLKMLTRAGGQFAIVTATFPKSLYHLFEKYNIPFVKRKTLKSDFELVKFYGDLVCRHKIALLKDEDGIYAREFDFEKIIEVSKRKKVLVIANTIARTQDIAEKLRGLCEERDIKIDIRSYHSGYIEKDRKRLEEHILMFAPNNGREDTETTRRECGVWVTTSVVEASLDIDFDCLFTELRSIDSLIQRIGRIYRARTLIDYNEETRVMRLKTDGEKASDVEKISLRIPAPDREPNVYILCNESGIYGESDELRKVQETIYLRSCKALERHLEQYEDGLIVECAERDDVRELMDFVYDENEMSKIDGEMTGYYRLVDKHIRNLSEISVYEYKKSEANRMFRGINSIKVIPDSVKKRYREEIESCVETLIKKISEFKDRESGYIEKQIARAELESYCVSFSSDYLVNLIRSRQKEYELYEGSDIFCVNMEYEFDPIKIEGKGLIKVIMDGVAVDERFL